MDEDTLLTVLGIDAGMVDILPAIRARADSVFQCSCTASVFEDLVAAEVALCEKMNWDSIKKADPSRYGDLLVVLIGDVMVNELRGRWALVDQGGRRVPAIRFGHGSIAPWAAVLKLFRDDDFDIPLSVAVFAGMQADLPSERRRECAALLNRAWP